jgi:hypothetical protein
MTLQIVENAPLSVEGDKLFRQLARVLENSPLDIGVKAAAGAMFCANIIVNLEDFGEDAETFFYTVIKRCLSDLRESNAE